MIRLRRDGPVWGRRGHSGQVAIAPGQTYEGPMEAQLLADFPQDFERVESEPVPPPPPEKPLPEMTARPVLTAGTYETRVMEPAPKRKRGRPRGAKNKPKG